ncbi:MAG: hypothetical protein OXN21_01025 [Chloroflexota bacterium]|nr:hypothetical protein [Chloroflexota bacterium]
MEEQNRQEADSDTTESDHVLTPASSPNPWLIGTDLLQARKRIRWGFGAGLAAATINFIVIMSTYFVGDSGVEGVVQPSRGEFIFVLVEAGLVAALGVGVLKRSRAMAAALLGYQLISKSALFGLALAGLGPGNLNPVSLVLNLVFAYLFFQGLRGVLTWHYLTHPDYPARAPESQFHEEREGTPGEGTDP